MAPGMTPSIAARTRTALFCAAALAVGAAALSPPGVEPTRPEVAIVPFSVGSGADTALAVALREQLAAQVFNTGVLDVTDENEVARVLGSRVPRPCGASCAIAAARALGVEYALYGSVRRADTALALQLTVVKVSSRQEWTYTSQTSETPELLLGAVRSLAASVAAAVPRPAQTRPAPPPPLGRARNALVSVTSEPSGARLTLNGQYMGTTPYSDSLIPGNYNVHIAEKGYNAFAKQVFFPASMRKQLKVTLSRPWASLAVSSSPTGATIAINNMARGSTPHTESKLEPGLYKVRLSMEGYVDTTNAYTARQGAVDSLHVTLLSRDSLTALTRHWKKQRQNARRILLGVAAAGCAVAGLAANGQVSQFVEDQKAAKDALAQPGLTPGEQSMLLTDFDEAQQAAQDAATARNWLYGVAAAFAIGFTVSIWF